MPSNLPHKIKQVSDIAGDTAGKVKAGASSAVRRARKAKDEVVEGIEGARITTSKVVNEANRIITEHPVAATAAAVAIGAIAAYFFPHTTSTIRKAAPRIAKGITNNLREAANRSSPSRSSESRIPNISENIGKE
jgi:ElaB/YqjD/DUF883 family membrane-anchored ribosome-binding protein